MVLNIPGALFDNSMFPISAEDGDTNTYYGNRQLAEGIQSITKIGTLLLPTIVVNDDIGGTAAWTNLDKAKRQDGVGAEVIQSSGAEVDLDDDIVATIVGGVTGGNSRHTNTSLLTVYNARTYGGIGDLWGRGAISVAEVNAFNFGASYVVNQNGGGAGDRSQYLEAMGFGFNVPAAATIVGVIIEVMAKQEYTGGDNIASVDYIKMSVYYT